MECCDNTKTEYSLHAQSQHELAPICAILNRSHRIQSFPQSNVFLRLFIESEECSERPLEILTQVSSIICQF